METSVSLISGLMFGFEYFYDEEEDEGYVILDLFLLRIMFVTKGN